VSDARLLSPLPHRDLHPDFPGDRAPEAPRLSSAWTGIIHEFRNQLSVVSAAAPEIRDEMPLALTPHIGEALTDTERSVRSMASLLDLVDASLRTSDARICDLDGAVQRAIKLAGPALGRGVAVAAKLDRKTGVKNRGSALEALLAALLVDLARASDDHGQAPRTALNLQIRSDVAPGSFVLELESDGPRPAAGSWRLLLASELASKLDAVIVSSPDAAAYAVQFR
jgi:hypothetical protein